MAQRRMLSKRISQSKKVNSLSLKAQIIYTWTIPWLDDYGCYTADPEDVKTEVFPKNKKIRITDIERALWECAEAGLITLYQPGESSDYVQQYINFDDFQTFKADRPRKSDYPQYQPENKGVIPLGNQWIPMASLKLSKDKLSKGKLSININKDNNPPIIPSKKQFLEFVFLSDEEHTKLVSRLGEKRTDDYIERLNNYIGSKGKKYKSHYHTILNWSNKDNGCSTDDRKNHKRDDQYIR